MTVKNIMFSGVMAAILMAGANAHAAVQIASQKYVDTEVANLQDAIDLKANAADVYTKADVYSRDEADAAFDKINSASAALTAAQEYTNTKVEDLANKIGDGSGSGLLADITELENTVGDETTGLVKNVNDLNTKVGNETVANRISNAITELDLANTYDAKGAAADAQAAAQGYTDTAIANLSGENGALTTLAAGVAANEEAIALKADKTTVDGIQTTINQLGDTYATDDELAAEKSALTTAIDAKVATETYNAKVGELESAIASNKTATETNATAIDDAVTELAKKITMPEICQSKNCVLSTLNGVPTWVEITIPVE